MRKKGGGTRVQVYSSTVEEAPGCAIRSERLDDPAAIGYIGKLKHGALAAPPPVTPKEKRRPFAAVRSCTAFTRSSTLA